LIAKTLRDSFRLGFARLWGSSELGKVRVNVRA
jgi:hypothetical protein